MKDDLLERLETMIAQTRENLATAQRQYECDHDNLDIMILRVHAGDKVSLRIIRAPWASLGLAHADANRTDTTLQSKLSSTDSGPHDIIRSTDRMATISMDCVQETVSLDRLAFVPRERT